MTYMERLLRDPSYHIPEDELAGLEEALRLRRGWPERIVKVPVRLAVEPSDRASRSRRSARTLQLA